MSPAMIQKLVLSVGILVAVHGLFHILKVYAKRTQQKFGIRKSRYFATRRLITIASWLVSVVALILVWDVNIQHVWVSATGVLALIAIAFFAVWSLVGNILAGVIIYFTSPFKVEDNIEVMPDAIRGTVLAINTFYTVLADAEGNYINVPNSMFFQKYVRVIRAGKPEDGGSQGRSD